MTGPAQESVGDLRVIPRFIGPASLVGVCIGTLFVGLPLWLDPRVYWLWILPLLGAPMLVAPGFLRQFGAGLLLSVALVPSLGLGWAFVFALGAVVAGA